MNALILAAGFGKRLRPLTLEKAKPAIEFYGVPMIGFSLYYLEKLGLKNLIINTHHLPKTIEAVMHKLKSGKYKIQYSHEDIIQGSTGGISAARDLIPQKDDFFVLNGDNVFLFPDNINPVDTLMKAHKKNKPLVSLLVMKHPDAGKKFNGVWCDLNNKYVKRGVNFENEGLTPYHFFGMTAYSPGIFEHLPINHPSELFDDILPELLKKELPIQLVPIENGHWFETGSIEDYNWAQNQFKNHVLTDATYLKSMNKILSRYSEGH